MLTRTRTRGFSMTDALATVTVILSTLAGTALLLLQSLRQQREALTEAAALRLSRSIAEDLRALRPSDAHPLQGAMQGEPGEACAEGLPACALEQQAARAHQRWQAELRRVLPQGSTLQLSAAGVAGGGYELRIGWRGSVARELVLGLSP